MSIAIYITLGIIIGLTAGIGFSILAFLIVSKNKAKVEDLVEHLESTAHGKAYFAGLSDEEQSFKEGVLDNKKDIKVE